MPQFARLVGAMTSARSTVPRSDIGEPFDEDTVEDRYLEVAARFS
ncbi:hypothetical protein [Dactylosporangium sp. NPDC006015]